VVLYVNEVHALLELNPLLRREMHTNSVP